MKRIKFYSPLESNLPKKEIDGWLKGKDLKKFTNKVRTQIKIRQLKVQADTRICNCN